MELFKELPAIAELTKPDPPVRVVFGDTSVTFIEGDKRITFEYGHSFIASFGDTLTAGHFSYSRPQHGELVGLARLLFIGCDPEQFANMKRDDAVFAFRSASEMLCSAQTETVKRGARVLVDLLQQGAAQP